MADDGSMSKVQMTLGLGCVSLIAPCIPCVGTMLYMVCLVGTMVLGFMAHSEAKETGESTTLAKVGMGISLIPLFLIAVLVVLYVLVFVFALVAGNM